MSEDDEIDALMPDPEEKGGTQDEFEIEIADDAGGGGVDAPDRDDDDAGEDAGARLANEDGEEELSAEDKKYSVSVQNRIKREQRLRRRQLETERQTREAVEADLAAARRETIEARLIATSMLVRGLDAELTVLTDQITKAKEAGKTAEEVALQTKINETQAHLREAKEKHHELEEAKKAPPTVARNPSADTWMGGNTWFNDPDFAGDAAKAREIDVKLTKEGKFSPKTPEYFAELDRRLHEELPKLRSKVKQAGLSATAAPQRRVDTRESSHRQPVLQQRERTASGDGAQRSKTKVVLTKADLENMVNFKMDPNNPAHLQQYARELMGQG